MLLACQQGIQDKHVSREDVVFELVKQLAEVVEEKGALGIVRELVSVFREVGDDKDALTREIWSLLKKDRTKNNKRILPVGVVHLLKAKMTVNGKKNILEKVLTLVEDESLISVKKISKNQDGLTLQLIWMPPMFQSFPAVENVEKQKKQKSDGKQNNTTINGLPDLDQNMNTKMQLQLKWVPPEQPNIVPTTAEGLPPSAHVPPLPRPRQPYGSVLKQKTQTNVVPPSEEDEPQQSENTTLKPENMTQGPKNTLQTINPQYVAKAERLKTEKDYDYRLLKTPPHSNSEKGSFLKAKIITEINKSGEEDENSKYSENPGKSSYYQIYASKLKKKTGSKTGKRSKLQTGSKTNKTGSERVNTYLEDQSGME
jgi:hypothetical protein